MIILCIIAAHGANHEGGHVQLDTVVLFLCMGPNGGNPQKRTAMKVVLFRQTCLFQEKEFGGILCTWQILSFKTHTTKYPVAANGNPHIDGEVPIWAGFLW